MTLLPSSQSILDLRRKIEALPLADREHARVDWPRQVAWLEHAVIGHISNAPAALQHMGMGGEGWFIRSHGSPRTLLNRMLLRARAMDDLRGEERLLRLALDFPYTFSR